jgi:hypothetical protein
MAAVSDSTFEGVWRQAVEGYRGALLADRCACARFALHLKSGRDSLGVVCSRAILNMSLDERRTEENFDLDVLCTIYISFLCKRVDWLAFLTFHAASIQADVVPHLGDRRVPSTTIKTLASCLQEASRVYDLDLPLSSPPSVSTPATSLSPSSPPLLTPEENRFATSFARQAAHESVEGTTAEIVPRPRERFAYRAFDLLFALCDRRMGGEYALVFLFFMR